MENRPTKLKGEANIRTNYIMAKVIYNTNIVEKYKYVQVIDKENLDKYQEGYKAYIFEEIPTNFNFENNYCTDVKLMRTLKNNDIVQINSNGSIYVLYRDDSVDNCIFVTNQCNSNCIMCPEAEIHRKANDVPPLEYITEYIDLLPFDCSYLVLTGGEPCMAKENLLKIIEQCKTKLNNTEFLLLSNGRAFSNTEFVNKFANVYPRSMRVGIPLYADNEELQDEITRVKGSFRQTICGIKKLLDRNIRIEIRIVVQKKNYKILENIVRYISNQFPKVEMVNIMSLEMCGNAMVNKDDVWINYEEIKEPVYKACYELVRNGIPVYLYNFPLCTLDEKVYSFATKSITDYKVKFKEECEECKLKENCGGFFRTTINMKDIKIKPIKGESYV